MKNRNKVLGLALLLALLLTTSGKAQKYQVDSLLCETSSGYTVFDKYVFSYDSLNRMTKMTRYSRRSEGEAWGKPLETSLHYDDKGRLVRISTYYEKSSDWDFDTKKFEPKDPYIESTIFEYDEEGHKISECYPSEKVDYTYDNKGRKASATFFEEQEQGSQGKWSPVKRYEYVYDSKGVLKNRLHLLPQNPKRWRNGKIVDTGESWLVVCTDLCDKNGNIIECRDYDSDKITRYTYDKNNRMTESRTISPEYDSLKVSKRIYKNITGKTELLYDSKGNVVHADNYYPTNLSSAKMNHAISVVATYDHEILASEVAGLKEAFFFACSDARRNPLKYLSDRNIEYPFTSVSSLIWVRTVMPDFWKDVRSDMSVYISIIDKPNLF